MESPAKENVSCQGKDQNDSGFIDSSPALLSGILKRFDLSRGNPKRANNEEHGESSPSKIRMKEECKDDLDCEVEKETGHCEKSRTIQVKEQGKLHHFQTDGKESVLAMIKREFKEWGINKNTKYMLFKRISNGSVVNFGLPTGALSKDEVYECTYKKELKYDTSELLREFDATQYSDSWNMQSFYVRCDKRRNNANISPMTKVVDLWQVPFFKGETLFEALIRDGRFNNKRKDGTLVVRNCHFELFEGGEQPKVRLDSDASQYCGKVFEPRYSKANPIDKEVKPLPVPRNISTGTWQTTTKADLLTNSKEVAKVKVEVRDNSPTLMAEAHECSNEPANSKSKSIGKKTRWSDEEKIKAIKEEFGLNFDQEKTPKAEKKRKDKIDTFCSKKFSLNIRHYILVADMRDLMNYAAATVGAIMAIKENLDGSLIKHCAGTCFRIGTQFVLTNAHVLDDIDNYGYKLGFVDFEHGVEESIRFNIDEVVIKGSEKYLDYAILKLQTPTDGERLPKPFIGNGYQIAHSSPDINDCITLIGHPSGLSKCLEPSCPVKVGDPTSMLYIRQRQDGHQHAQYHVGTFFDGSSGSPGFLLRQKKLVVLHCRGFHQNTPFSFEEGILMSSIVNDVKEKIGSTLFGVTLEDLFGVQTASAFDDSESMDID